MTGYQAILGGVDGTDELERVYREEATRIRASLAARLGDVGLAEELVQDAFVEALEHWPDEGAPPNPGGWLATTARRKAIDRLRRERAGQEKLALLAAALPRGPAGLACDVPGPAAGWEAGDQDEELLGLRRPGPYQIQAAIAALHAEAPSSAQTDWRQIRLLYDRLDRLAPSPVVRLNRAVATQFAVAPQAALAEVEPLAAELDGYRLFHSVRAELLRAVGRGEEARRANERALALAANPAP
jgi:predicted RNA polymerase sigma factor